MVSLLDLVLGNGKPDDAGELHGGAYGAPPRRRVGAGRPLATGPLVEQEPSDRSSTAEIRTFLFAAIFF